MEVAAPAAGVGSLFVAPVSSPPSRAERYDQAVKLDRAAFRIRNELREAHPSEVKIKAELRHARKAIRGLG